MTLMLSIGLSTFIAACPVAQCGSSSSHADHTTVQASNTAPRDIVETAVAAGNFTTLAAALQAAGLVDALRGEGPFTVFAPTDDAFAALPGGTVESLLKPENRGTLAAILTFHVVPGRVMASDVTKLEHATTLNGQRVEIGTDERGVTIDGARVVKTDIACSNGVIHVIDRVIMPETRTIPEVAASAGTFETLVAAIGAAGLGEALGGEGPFTVFAPTDAAFAALPAGTLDSLLKPENRAKLVGILKYHVVSGRVFADQVVGLETAQTLQGSDVRFSVKDGKAMVNGATITATDIEASNGVVHVIDRVILPQN